MKLDSNEELKMHRRVLKLNFDIPFTQDELRCINFGFDLADEAENYMGVPRYACWIDSEFSTETVDKIRDHLISFFADVLADCFYMGKIPEYHVQSVKDFMIECGMTYCEEE